MTVRIERPDDLAEKILQGIPLCFDIVCRSCETTPKRIDDGNIDELDTAEQIAKKHDLKFHNRRGKILVRWGENDIETELQRESDEFFTENHRHGDNYETTEFEYLGPDTD